MKVSFEERYANLIERYNLLSQKEKEIVYDKVSPYLDSISSAIEQECGKYKYFLSGNLFNKFAMWSNESFEGICVRNAENMRNMFLGCEDAKYIDLSNFDTSGVIDMSNLFSSCRRVEDFDVSRFDTSSVVNMSGIFEECKSLVSLDLSNFDTHAVKNMHSMFRECVSLKSVNVSSFDTSNSEDISHMFYGCKSLESIDLSNFNTSKVGNISYMFFCCESLSELDLSGFDTKGVWDMERAFDKCTSLKKVILGPKCLNLKEVIPEGVEIVIKEDTVDVNADVLYEKCPTVYKSNHTREECIEYMKQFNN